MSLKKSFKLSLAVVMLILGLSYFVEPRSTSTSVGDVSLSDFRHAVELIEQQFGIALVFDQGTEALPEAWQIPPANGRATPADWGCLASYLSVVEVELAKYKPEIVVRHLDTLFVFRDLELFGVGYGGTVVANEIMLTLDCDAGYTKAYFARALHHEFSSILINLSGFPLDKWLEINPPSFRYLESDEDILESVAIYTDRAGHDDLYQAGFLTYYGQSTVENDINTYAELLMTDPVFLAQLAEKHERVKAKAALLEAFYLNHIKSTPE